MKNRKLLDLLKRGLCVAAAGAVLALLPAECLADTPAVSAAEAAAPAAAAAAPAPAAPAAAAEAPAPAAPAPTAPAAGFGPVDEQLRFTRETAAYEALITGSKAITCLMPKRPEITSMAGGVEILSTRSVGFAGDLKGLTEKDTLPVQIPLAEVMNGRTLRVGEAVYGLYDIGGGYFMIGTTITGPVVTVDVPCIHMNQGTTITFFVGRGEYHGSAGVDYLAIGNSITIHPRRDFWPNAMGMGASALQNDYFHIVQAGLSKKFGNVTGIAANFAIWESMEGDRTYDLTLLNAYLAAKPEIISVQLGENFKDNENFGLEYEKLVAHIRAACPESHLILVSGFFANDGQDAVKQAVAAKYGAAYVDISAIRNQPKYCFGINDAFDANGMRHHLSNPGTAIHPNDAAMSYIAQAILKIFEG